jgi:hypothetical protein
MTTPFYRRMNDVQFDDSNVRNNPDNVKVDDSIMPDHVTTSEGGDGTSIAEEVKIIESIDQEKAELKALLSRAGMAGLSYPYAMSSDHIPGMEGFFSRVWNEITGWFHSLLNWHNRWLYNFKALYKQDWFKHTNTWFEALRNNMPSDEQFSGTVAFRADKAEINKHIACLTAVCKMIKNLDKVILSPDRDEIPKEMQNVCRYLELNECTVDLKRPSSSKSATRFTYGSMGRLGTMGYGSSCTLWIANMRNNLQQFKMFYDVLTDADQIAKVVRYMENELNAAYGKADKASDREKGDLSQRALIIKARVTALRAILTASVDLFNTTFITDVMWPLSNLGRQVGMGDNLTSWILATNND